MKQINVFLKNRENKKVEREIKEKLYDLNSCGFKGISTEYGIYSAYDGQVKVSVHNTDEEIEAIAKENGYSAKVWKTEISKDIREYFAQDDVFFVVEIPDYTQADIKQIIPQELTDVLVQAKEAGFKGMFNLHYKPLGKGLYEIRLTYQKYNGWFNRK